MSGNKIVKAGIGYTIGNYMLKGLTFFTIPIFTRLLSTDDYGIYSTFIAYEGILYVIIEMAMNSSYKSAWYRYKNQQVGKDYYSYVSTSMILIMISTTIWFLLFIIGSSWLSNLLGLSKVSLILLVVYSASGGIIACFNAHVSIQYEYKRFIKISGINAISNIVLSLVLINTFFTNTRYLGRMIGTAVPALFIAVYIIITFLRKAKPGNYKEFVSWGLKYSLPIIPYGIGLVLLGTFDRIMITKIDGPNSTGIYSFAYNIFALVNVTAISLDNVWSPWLYEKMDGKNYSVIRKRGSKYTFLMLLFSSIVILLGPELVKILGSKDYWDAAYCVIPIVAGGYFSFLCTLPISVEYFYERTKLIAGGTIIAGLLNIVLNYIFIIKYGYVAAAYTTLVTYMLYFLIHYIVVKKIHGSSLFDNRKIFFCALSILVVAMISRLFICKIFIRWSIAIIMGIIFLVIEEKDFGFIKKLLKIKK